jgi:hypothetical protein
MKKTRRIVNSRLPGRYGEMTAEELDAEVARFDQEIPENQMKPLTPGMKADLRRAKRGRPRIGRGARRVLITVERGLLSRADSYAKNNGMSRSELIAHGLKSVLGSTA